MEKIVITCDHGGVALKEVLAERLSEKGYAVVIRGAERIENRCDYPDIALESAKMVINGEVKQGIFICGTGLGICIAANKVRGIRAVTCSDTFSARMARAHNDAQILCLGARVLGVELALEVVLAFLEGEFEGNRHETRVKKIMDIEKILP